jgi:hypothetical protein
MPLAWPSVTYPGQQRSMLRSRSTASGFNLSNTRGGEIRPARARTLAQLFVPGSVSVSCVRVQPDT